MKKLILFVFIIFGANSLTAQTYQFLKLVIDTSANLQFRELEWFDEGTNYPIPTMTAYNAPSPLVVTGSNANWERYRIYDDDSGTHAQVGYVTAHESDFHEFILNLGVGNPINPDSIQITKPMWSVLSKFRVLLSNDEINWELYLDTTLTDQGFTTRYFPLELVVDIDPPEPPENLIASCQTSSQIYLDWDPPINNDVNKYFIYQNGNLIDSTFMSFYAVQDLTNNTSFNYFVTAVDFAQNESNTSSTITAMTLQTDNTPPTLSGGISTLSINPTVVEISWNAGNDNQGLAGYLVQLDGVYVGTTTLPNFGFSGLEEQTSYTATVFAKDLSGNLSSPISTTFNTTAGDDKMKLGTNFWNQIWSSASNQLFVNGYQNVVGPNPWKPALLSELDYAQTLRFMEMHQVNREPIYIWLDRKLKSNTYQDELAFEWMIDLCNRKNANLWITLPNRVIDQNGAAGDAEHFIKKLAILIKTGIDMGDRNLDLPEFANMDQFTPFDFKIRGGVEVSAPLAPGLKVYIEYGNENWNNTFPQTGYCAAEGQAMGLGWGPASAGRLFNAYASVVLFEEFELIFGANNPRIEKVLPIQATGQFYTNLSFTDIIDLPAYNPTGVMPDIISGHTYFGNGSDGADPMIESILNNAIATYSANAAALRSFLDDLGNARGIYLKMISYEGGHHVVTNFEALNQNPIIYDVYLNYLDSMNQYYEEIILYSHVATNAFGLKQYVGQPIASAHKYRAVIDWIQGVPLPVSLGQFYAEKKKEEAMLFWTTLSETNNKGFEIQHSSDGLHFETIGYIDGKINSHVLNFYNYIDRQPTKGFNYYRLRQLDLNGKATFSDIISLEFKQSSSDILVSPNPFKNRIYLEYPKDWIESDIRIVDLNGIEVYRTENQVNHIDVSHLPLGVFFLHINGEVIKLVKSSN